MKPETAGGLVVSRGQPAAVLQLREASPDVVSESVDAAVDDGLDLAVPLGRDDGDDASGFQVVADEVGVVGLIGQQHAGPGTGRVHHRRLSHPRPDRRSYKLRQGSPERCSGGGSCSRSHRASGQDSDPDHPFKRASGVLMARMMVKSFIWTLARPSPVAFSASSNTSKSPLRPSSELVIYRIPGAEVAVKVSPGRPYTGDPDTPSSTRR